ncbi:MAG: hypothetical protein L0Y58_03230 [Verrucomicrobia subdivision 3 bacterium]|nr:hypothetical protein [Limisphaerales bacterium]
MIKVKQRASSVLSLALDGGRLEGVVVRRSNGSLHTQKALSVSLALNPLTADPELVGREIRNHLNQAGIRERRCLLGLPLNSVLTLLTEIPEMPEEDVPSFLQIEAERGFPYGLEALTTATSRFATPGGKQFALSIALPRNHVLHLERALKAAQLKPLCFSLNIAALQSPEGKAGVLALAIGENTVDLQISCGGGVASLRSLDEAFATEELEKHLSAGFLAREIKITLGQLPADIREALREVRVFGRGDAVRDFVQEVMPGLAAMGLSVRWIERYTENEFPKKLPPEAEVSPALSLAARYLTSIGPAIDCLPPKTTALQQLTSRLSSRKLAWAGAAAAAIALLVGGAFGWQQWELSRLQRQWGAMEANVRELDNLQQRIKKFRPWFDESYASLSILRKLTEAFPEEGAVTAKTVEIRELSTVTCSGVARDNQAFLKMLDQLRASKEISDVKVDQVRGKAPMQFTFNFQWGAKASEN